MKVREIMTSHPFSCHQTAQVCEAISIMREHNYTVVPVIDGMGGKKLVGVLSDRDIALEMGDPQKACKDISIESCMRKPVYFCHPEDDVQQAEQLMKEHKVNYIAVTDQNGNLEGILFLADLAREIFREKQEGRHEVTETELAEIVEVIASGSPST